MKNCPNNFKGGKMLIPIVEIVFLQSLYLFRCGINGSFQEKAKNKV